MDLTEVERESSEVDSVIELEFWCDIVQDYVRGDDALWFCRIKVWGKTDGAKCWGGSAFL